MKSFNHVIRWVAVFVIVLFACNVGPWGFGQSGRIKEKVPKNAPTRPRNTSQSSSEPSEKARIPPVLTKPVASPSPAKTTTSDEIDEDDIVRVSSNLVPIPVSVIDAKGFAITGLKLEDFELRVDGQVRSISELTRAESPVRLLMLFDNSGSLHASREFEKRAAMQFFRKVMRPSDEAGIYSVEVDSYLAQPLTKDISLLEQTIDRFGRPEGGTSLFDAVIDAAAYLRPYQGRRILVIVSDGIETTSRNDFAATIQQVLADDCQVFIVQTGLYDGANLRALAAERRMEQIAASTGGAVYIPKTNEEVALAFQQIAADLSQQYVLSYYPNDERRDGRFHVIDLKVRQRKDVRVRARKGYYSPRAAGVAVSERENF